MVRYSHTTIDFASWPDLPMFNDGETEHVTETLHLKHRNFRQEIDVEVTVG